MVTIGSSGWKPSVRTARSEGANIQGFSKPSERRPSSIPTRTMSDGSLCRARYDDGYSGCHGALLTCRSPVPREQIGDFVSGVIWKAGEHVSEPGLRIDVVHLAGFDQGINGGGTMAASV